MRRHDTWRIRTTAAGLIATGVLGVVSACGGGSGERSDDAAATPAASESSSSTAAATAAASPIASAALDAAITLTAPTQDAAVGRSFVVRGSGVAFEGTLLWKLSDGAGVEAVSGFASAGATEKQPFQFTVEAPQAGTYTLTVYRESADDGSPTDVVTRRLTVR
ncbi:Gmad2 immunoglobulin-like domain-containing protein [Cryptosporangium arvum]|uniref:Gmad2 immunoglobulin-like domain-containing protein n=1 Tax=Cryptosporangium arvum TaxID=80871 RepID=UPI0004B55AED|nr:Gmad2 immunoglobulin-like domain-containing protein [Cryptosporangium arvum]